MQILGSTKFEERKKDLKNLPSSQKKLFSIRLAGVNWVFGFEDEKPTDFSIIEFRIEILDSRTLDSNFRIEIALELWDWGD